MAVPLLSVRFGGFALAAGGDGGGSDSTPTGGAGGSYGMPGGPGPGSPPIGAYDGGGGGGGGVGAAGGAGGTGGVNRSIPGGAGGAGGAAGVNGSPGVAVTTSEPSGYSGGGGGGGGGGTALTIATDRAVGANLTGGSGGAGGNSVYGGGGGGGAGGYGIYTNAPLTLGIGNGISVFAGNGGKGGDVSSAFIFTGLGGNGGDGGIGIFGSGFVLTNAGTVQGGAGGAGGTSASGNGNAGVGGAGIVGDNLTIINSGTIAGGRANNGAGALSNAITFSAGTNTLELQAGSAITGNVVAVAGGTDTFRLGGAGNASFNVATIGSAAQYQNFTNFVKTGASTWTLTGTTSAVTPWSINQGTLSVAQDGSLGGPTGALTFNGGTLGFTASFNLASTRAITLNATGGTFDTNGFNTLISQAIGGSGGLRKIGAGTLTLAAANAYMGTTTNTGGTLAIAAGGSVVSDVINSATFNNAGRVNGQLFNLAGTSTNAGTLNGGATVSGGTLTTTGTINNGVTNTATINANGGAINGAIANNAGTFNVGGTVTGGSTFGNANGATLAVNNGSSLTLSGSLTNAGALTVAVNGLLDATLGGLTNTSTGTIAVTAGGTIRDDLNNAGVVTNNGNFFANVASNSGTITNTSTGLWTGNVAGNFGLIVNNGIWTGNIATITGGQVSGTGSVANASFSGGTFAPGSGVAGSSMAVTGSLAFASAATYLIAVNPGAASTTNVGGSATLGGARVNAVYDSGAYIARRYTILTATGGVVGTFGSLTSLNLPANVAAALSYDASHVYLNLAPDFGSGLNQNQQAVASTIVNYFNTTGGVQSVFSGLSRAGLTQASGEIATRTQQTTFNAMDLFVGLITDPTIAGRGDAFSALPDETDPALGYARKRDVPAPLTRPVVAPQWRVWAAGIGGTQATDGNAAIGSNAATSQVAAGVVGADYRFSPNTLAGFAMAGGGTNFAVNGLGSGNSNLFQAGAFVRHRTGQTYLTAALAYGWQDVTSDRTMSAAGAESLRARFNVNALSGRVEAGYRYANPWIALTPYAAGQFSTAFLPSYGETGAGGANTFALNFAGKDVTASRTELGLRGDKSFAMADGILTLRARAAWAHNFDVDRSLLATFQALPGASFTVTGAAQAANAALTSASAQWTWSSGWSTAVLFESEISNATRSYAGKGFVRYNW